MIGRQVIVAGMGEILDLNILSIEVAFDDFGISGETRSKYRNRLMGMFRKRIQDWKLERDEDG